MTPVSHGKPCAGTPHARFEEGASASETPRRSALLHQGRQCIAFIVLLLVGWTVLADAIMPAKRFALKDDVVLANMYQAITNGNGKAAYELFLHHSVWRADDAEAHFWLWLAKSLGNESAMHTLKAARESGGQLTVESVFRQAPLRANPYLKIDRMVNGIICFGRSMLANDQEKGEREKGVLLYYGCQMELLNKVITGGMKGQSLLIQVRQAKLGRTNSGRSYIVKKSTYD